VKLFGFFTPETGDSEGLWGKKKTGLRITDARVKIEEKQMIQNTWALNAEEGKTEDIAGTVGPPEIFRILQLSSHAMQSIRVVGPCKVHVRHVKNTWYLYEASDDNKAYSLRGKKYDECIDR
jgi:hypothetical protein